MRLFAFVLVALLLVALVVMLPLYAIVLGVVMVLAALVTATVNAFTRQREARRWGAISSYYALTPEQFEQHVATMFEYQGYGTTLTPRTGDQGVDVIARKGDEVIGIQCKRYADPAPNTAVQAVHSGSKYYGCNEATLVCLGGFSRAARELAGVVSVKLIDGNAYADMVNELMDGNGSSPIRALPSVKVAALAATLLLIGVALISYGLVAHLPAIAQTAPHVTAAKGRSATHVITVFALILIIVGALNARKRRRRRHGWW